MARLVKFEGKTIRVPDDATDDEIAAIIESVSPATSKEARTPFQRDYPILSKVGDVAAGMSSVPRGALNIIGGMFGQEKLGEQIMPLTDVDKESLGYLAGQIIDPTAMMIGGGAGKLAMAAPKIGAIGQGMLGGALGGGAVAGLSEGDIGTGAAFGGMLGGALPIAARGVGKLTDVVTGKRADVKAGQILRDVAGDRLTDAKVMLNLAPNNVTTAQAVGAEAPSAFAALEDIVGKGRLPDTFRDIAATQEAERAARMGAVAGGDTAEASIVRRGVLQKRLANETNPTRIAELTAANTANEQMKTLGEQLAAKKASMISAMQQQGRMATEAAQQDLLSQGQRASSGQLVRNLPEGSFPRDPSVAQPGGLPTGAFPVPGMPRVPPRYTGNAEAAEQFGKAADDLDQIAAQRRMEKQFIDYKIGSLDAYGLKPLTPDPIVENIARRMGQPGDRATSTVQKVLGGIRDAIQNAADMNGGMLDAFDLHAIRKYEINSIVDTLLKDASKTDKTQAAKLAKGAKDAIDAAIENAGGTEWKSYLNRYATGMRDIDKMTMAQVAKDLSGKQLIKLTEGNKPKMVEKVFGPYNKGFAGEMGQQAEPFMQSAAEIARDRALKENARLGRGLTQDILEKNLPLYQLPNILRTEITTANKGLRFMSEFLNKKTLDTLAEATANPSRALELMNTIPADERLRIYRAMSDPRFAGIVGGQTGMMTGRKQ